MENHQTPSFAFSIRSPSYKARLVSIDRLVNIWVNVGTMTSEHFVILTLGLLGTVEGLRIEESVRLGSPGLSNVSQTNRSLVFCDLNILNCEYTPFPIKGILMANKRKWKCSL